VAAPLELNRKMLSPELLRQLGESGIGVEAPSAALVAVAIALVAARWRATATSSDADLPEGRYEVVAVQRADVIELANRVEVRLLGVAATGDPNSPQSTASRTERSARALAFTRDFVAGGDVRLQFDRTRVDSADRYLAYVWVDGPRGERLLNEELLRAGLADPSPASLALCSSSMKRRLTRAAEAAKRP
jgi:endonuclease YncB( thermonuclease family)